jgi:hypothetical protein
VAAPLRAANGALVVDGWTATQALSGRHEPRRWADIIAVGGRFHATLARLERPGFIDRRMNPWAVADRVAWGEEPPDPFIGARHLKRLMSALRPLHARPQLVHSDLTGNAAYAAAIVVGDALT